MFYRKYKPCQFLQPYVECFYLWEADFFQDLSIVSPPSGFTSIVFNYGTSYSVATDQTLSKEAPKFFVTGQSTHKYVLKISGTIRMIGIVFRPAALTSLFHIPVSELVDQRLDLASVLGADLDELGNLLMDEPDRQARIALLQAFFLGQLAKAPAGFDAVDAMVNGIVHNNGLFDIDKTIKLANMSRRQFERRFYQKVGLSPKYYGRIRRISHICSLMASGKKIDWPKMIYDHGFYDQSHFIKNFKEFLGETPQQYVKLRPELAHLLQK